MSVLVPARRAPVAAGSFPAAGVPPQQQGGTKATVGGGAGVLMTEWLLPMILPGDAQRKAARALALGDEVPYVRMAERAISGAVGGNKLVPGVGWHLEDPAGDTIDEQYKGDPRAVEAFRLIDQPFRFLDVQSPLKTRRQLWEITSRHMGLAGYGFWVLDGMDQLGIPRAMAYVRPDRIMPDTDERGNLTQWMLDPKPGPSGKGTGTPLTLGEVVQFQFQPPSTGYLPVGLIESAIMKVQLAGAIDKHFATILSGGGRLSGIISPKQGSIDDDEVYNQMVRDWRNITEQPESAKRVQIVRGPIEFTRTTATTVEMALVDFLKQNEADLLTVWGVPLSQLGGYTPAGLNSGDVRKYDRQAMWENAIIPRLSELSETAQGQILDRFIPLLGWAPTLIMDVPSLEDDSPRYDKAQKAQFVTLTNDERRDMLGREPLEDATLGSQILMPNTLVPLDELGSMAQLQQTQAAALVASNTTGGSIEESTAGAAQAAAGKARGNPPAFVFGRPNPNHRGGPGKPTTGRRRGGGRRRGRARAAARPKQAPRHSQGGKLRYARNRSLSFGRAMKIFRGGKAKDLADLDQGKVEGTDVTSAVVAALRKQWPADVLADIGQGKWKYVPDYPLAKIDYARRPVARNPKIVAGVEAALAVGAPMDPVVLVKTKRIGGSNGLPTEPIDGWHRLLAAEHAGLDTVPAYIGSGDDQWTAALIQIDDELPTPSDSAGTKASVRDSIIGLRETLQDVATEPIRASVGLALETIKRDVIARVRTQYDHIRRVPGDMTAWWNEKAANTAMTDALRPALTDVALTVNDHVSAVLPPLGAKAAAVTTWLGGPPSPAAVTRVLDRGAGRVTRINETTRDGLRELIAAGIEDGLSPADLGDAIEEWSGFDEYRAERIATTELMFAYNAAALETYRDLGVDTVEAVDGIEDDECAARNGEIFAWDEAVLIEDHPNGTLDWIPILPSDAGAAAMTEGE